MRNLAIAATLIALTLAGCSSSDDTSSSTTMAPTTGTSTTGMMNHTMMTHKVSIAGSAFVNGTITVMAGDSVEWTHADGNTAHTVTADDASFDSSPNCAAGVPLGQVCMVNGSTFTQAFPDAGSFPYHCKIHSSMKGTITVQAMMM